LYVVDIYRQLIGARGLHGGGRDVPNVTPEILNKYGLRAGSHNGGASTGSRRQATPAEPDLALAHAPQKELHERARVPGRLVADHGPAVILEKPTLPRPNEIVHIAATAPRRSAAAALWTLEALGKLDAALVAEALARPSAGRS